MAVQQISKVVQIPQNDFAYLMYYLNCMDVCLDGFFKKEFIDYQNYHKLNHEQQEILITLCFLISPDLLDGKVIFQVPFGDKVLNGASNNFFQITELKNKGVSSLNVGEKVVNVNKIMFYIEKWILSYYVDPMIRLLKTFVFSTDDEKPSAQQSSKITTYAHWFFLNDDKKWHPFQDEDNEDCEKQFKSGAPSTTLKSGLYVIHFSSRLQVRPSTGKTRKIVRGTWFWIAPNSKLLIPYPENIAMHLEEAFQQVKSSNSPLKVLTENGRYVILEPTKSTQYNSNEQNPIAVRRGWARVTHKK